MKTLFNTIYRTQVIMLALLGYMTLYSWSVTANTYDFSALTENLEKTKQLANMPSGTSIVAIKGNQIIYQAHIGFADIENKLNVNADTPYYIASITKPFMALNVLLDIEQKRLPASLTLSEMFPALEVNGVEQQDVNIQHLITHSSGITNIPLTAATAYSGEYNNESLLALVDNYTVKDVKPLGEFKYTNVGYNLYSTFADRYFKQSWQNRLDEQVFKPLKLKRTSASRSFFDKQNIAVAKPYSLMVRTLPKPLPLEKQDKTMHAAGGMFASTNDLATFVIAQLNQGRVNNQVVFPAKVIQQSQQTQVSTQSQYMDFKRTGYAWGWYTGEYKGQQMLHHFGGFSGDHTHVSFMPEQQIGLIILNNEDFLSARLTSVIADYIYGQLLGEQDVESNVEKRFAEINQRVANIDKMLDHEEQKIASRKMNLSLPIDLYPGQYQHPHLGTISVTKTKAGQLNVNWGVMSSVATGFDKLDQTRVTLIPNRGQVIAFNVDKDAVQSLEYSGLKFNRL